ncbi:hypothetical protein B0T24DRAFT_56288 [Lasiosphaeria ovina]|uniref:Uncharacterized protein n=1 Tax=Lasiosphaeria ovina TaxID=92902 RepID=A0AAE0NLF4_9PEZI|nr:hypothetical protein B0T24DRAFT_56288 [Lasiosphaeria ovina]
MRSPDAASPADPSSRVPTDVYQGLVPLCLFQSLSSHSSATAITLASPVRFSSAYLPCASISSRKVSPSYRPPAIMKTSAISALLAPAALAHAQWWGGAPDCAQSCFSSFWSSTSAWPAPTNYCGATQAASVSNCLASSCSATPTAVSSYSSLSSSICSQWSSCSSAGSTSVFTVNAPAFTGSWGPGQFGPGGHGGPGGPGGPLKSAYSDFTKTWTGGVYTVTGCEWNGSPWAGGPGGFGPGGAAGSPWGDWGHGWDWSTATQTVTQVVTITSGSTTSLSTSIGLATVAQAVSGSVTSTTILSGPQAAATSSSAAAPGAAQDSAAGVKIMGAMLGMVVAVAGLL